MANKNKNKEKLVSLTDDDPTAEFEVSSLLQNIRDGFEPEIEVDAQTFDIDNQHSDLNGKSRIELISALKNQAAVAEEMKFEIVQLQGRQRGLEEELKAREDISVNVTDEIRETGTQLEKTLHDLDASNNENSALQRSLEKANKLAEHLDDKSHGLNIAAKEYRRKIRTLESDFSASEKRVIALQKDLEKKQTIVKTSRQKKKNADEQGSPLETELRDTRSDLAGLRSYIDGRKDEWHRLETELGNTRNQLADSRTEIERLSGKFDTQTAQLIRSREQYITTSDRLSKQKSKVRELSKKNRELKRALYQDAELEISACRTRIAELSGGLEANSHELDKLHKDNHRIEQYSDSLRIQLQDQTSISKVSVAMRQKLEAGLDSANEFINRLSGQVEKEQQLNKELSEAYQKLHKDFEREVREIRFELGSAQDTISGQETINEELASDLIDHRGFRQALEAQLGEVERESDIAIRQLTRQLQKARQENDDYERKLRIKDSAIVDLMRELATHSSNIEFQGDIENVLQKIDGFRTDKQVGRAPTERDPVARLLIGNADGKELRFPLFKDRLTIGRTSNNDIQLNMQFISRRHAVISTSQGQTRVIDWSSKNGVFVNDKQVTEHILKPGDILTIGTTEFKYEERTKR